MYTYIHTYIHTCIQTYTHTQTHTETHTYKHTYVYILTQTHTCPSKSFVVPFHERIHVGVAGFKLQGFCFASSGFAAFRVENLGLLRA